MVETTRRRPVMFGTRLPLTQHVAKSVYKASTTAVPSYTRSLSLSATDISEPSAPLSSRSVFQDS